MFEQQRSFSVDPDYSQLLSGAHRKPATPIGAPSIVAHFAFWQPPYKKPTIPDTDLSIKTKSNKKLAVEIDWKTSVDKYIYALYGLIKEKSFISPNKEWHSRDTDDSDSQYIFLFSHIINLKNDPHCLEDNGSIVKNSAIDKYFHTRNLAIVFQFVWHYLNVTLRFENHQEYLTLTVFIDLTLIFDKSYEDTISGVASFSKADDPIFNSLISDFSELSNNLSRYQAVLKTEESPYIEGKHWRDVFQSSHDKLYIVIWDQFLKEILLSDTKVSDLNIALTNNSGKIFDDAHITIHDLRNNLGEVFADFRGLITSPPHPNPALSSQGSILQLPSWRKVGQTQMNWPGVFLSDQEAREKTQEFWPFVTCEKRLSLPKTEITVSRMLNGRAIYITALGAQPSPYLGNSSERRPDQVPVYYLIYVTTFSRWQIGRLVDNINHLGTVRIAAIQELNALARASKELRGLQNPNGPEEMIEIQNKIDFWDTWFSISLNYRIERSRYYVRQFLHNLPSLRIRRVEGYQTYDQFVLRRLESTFDFIDRLGMRVERFKNNLNRIAQASSANAQTEHVATLVELQKYAEIALWFFLAPYYFRDNLGDIVSLSNYDRKIIWIVFGLWGVFRLYQIEKTKKDKDHTSMRQFLPRIDEVVSDIFLR